MIYTKMTKKALKICFEAHKNQTDKSGMPYVFHPFHLAEQMSNEISTTVALLHDVIEDTEVTISDLRKAGFPKDVIDAVKLLTHSKPRLSDEEYIAYINAIKENSTATEVKLADLQHNSDLTRLENITEKDISRNSKYKMAIQLLTNNT